jgi:hypothetical protein
MTHQRHPKPQVKPTIQYSRPTPAEPGNGGVHGVVAEDDLTRAELAAPADASEPQVLFRRQLQNRCRDQR